MFLIICLTVLAIKSINATSQISVPDELLSSNEPMGQHSSDIKAIDSGNLNDNIKKLENFIKTKKEIVVPCAIGAGVLGIAGITAAIVLGTKHNFAKAKSGNELIICFTNMRVSSILA